MKRMTPLICAGLATAALAVAGPAAAQQRTFVTGPIGGSWYPIGSAMIEVIEKETGETFTQQPGGGVSNAFAVGGDKAQLGIGTGHVSASAVAGEADFEGRAQKSLRLIATLYPQQYFLVTFADSGIDSVGDLKGKAITTTRRGSSTELMTRRVLDAYGLSYDDLASVNHANVSDGVNQMKDGQTDAMSHLITNPAAHGMELQSVEPIKVVPLSDEAIDELTSQYPGYYRTRIPAGTYESQSEDVPTIGDGAVLITNAAMDEDLVYNITKALYENKDQLAAARSVMKTFTPENGAADPSIEFHPGALKYYKEVGVIE